MDIVDMSDVTAVLGNGDEEDTVVMSRAELQAALFEAFTDAAGEASEEDE